MQDLAVQPQPEQDGCEVGQPDPHGNDADNSGSHGAFSSKQPEYCPHRIDVSSSRVRELPGLFTSRAEYDVSVATRPSPEREIGFNRIRRARPDTESRDPRCATSLARSVRPPADGSRLVRQIEEWVRDYEPAIARNASCECPACIIAAAAPVEDRSALSPSSRPRGPHLPAPDRCGCAPECAVPGAPR